MGCYDSACRSENNPPADLKDSAETDDHERERRAKVLYAQAEKSHDLDDRRR